MDQSLSAERAYTAPQSTLQDQVNCLTTEVNRLANIIDSNVLTAKFLPFSEVRQQVINALAADPSLYISYHCNIAMLLHDRYKITDYDTRNRAARDVLDLCFPRDRATVPVQSCAEMDRWFSLTPNTKG